MNEYDFAVEDSEKVDRFLLRLRDFLYKEKENLYPKKISDLILALLKMVNYEIDAEVEEKIDQIQGQGTVCKRIL